MPARKKAASRAVTTKANAIKKALAKETGVSLEEVEKILDHLGLEQALANRLTPTRGWTPGPASKIRLEDIRLVAGSVPI